MGKKNLSGGGGGSNGARLDIPVSALMAAMGRSRLLTVDEARASGYCTADDYAAASGLGRWPAQRELSRGYKDGTIERVAVSGRGGGYAYRAKGAK